MKSSIQGLCMKSRSVQVVDREEEEEKEENFHSETENS